MTINISLQDVEQNLHPKITVLGVGGSGGNAVNNMIEANLEGVDFLIANTDAQALQISKCSNKIQLGLNSTRGLGAGMRPEIGKQAAEEAIQDLADKLDGSHMLFIAAGMGGGTGTGAAPVIAKLAREKGILTVGVVTKPFHFEGSQRMKLADNGIDELQQFVDTLLTIPNQNLFRIANEKTTFSDAFKMADDVLYAGVRGVTDLMVQPGMINLDFSDIKTVMSEMGKAMMGTGEASGEGRAISAAEAAIANPLIDDVSLKGARGLIINITGGKDITLYEVDEAANRIRQEVDENANIIYGTTCDERLEGLVRVSIVATGIDADQNTNYNNNESYASLSINNEIYKNNLVNNDAVIEEKNNIKSEIDIVETKEINHDQANEDISFENIENFTQNEDEDEIDKNINDINDNYTENEKTENLSNPSELDESENLQINELQETHSDNDVDTINEDISDNISENNLLNQKSTETLKEPSVRRLSLFDNISSEKDSSIENKNIEKSEPILKQESIENSHNHHSEDEKIGSDEFDPSNEKTTEIDEEFNQETEEELLDIPTFLRRQAN